MFTLDEIINSKKMAEIPRRLAREANDYSTKQARADAVQRQKLQRQLLAQFSALTDALTDDSVDAIRAISDAEWQAAQEQDDAA